MIKKREGKLVLPRLLGPLLYEAKQRLGQWARNRGFLRQANALVMQDQVHLTALRWWEQEDGLWVRSEGLVVHGRNAYETTWTWHAHQQEFRGQCSCPRGQRGKVCIHMVALAQTTLDFLSAEWERHIAKPAPPSSSELFKNMVRSLQRRARPAESEPKTYSLVLILKRLPAEGVWTIAVEASDEEGPIQRLLLPLSPEEVPDLPPLAVRAVSMFLNWQHVSTMWYYSVPHSHHLLNLAEAWWLLAEAAKEAPIYVHFPLDDEHLIKLQVWPADRPVKTGLLLQERKDDYVLAPAVHIEGQTTRFFALLQERPIPLLVVENRWLVVGTRPEMRRVFEGWRLGPVGWIIPKEETRELENVLTSFLPYMPIWTPKGELQVEDLKTEPQPRLYLREHAGELVAELRFGYGPVEVPYNPKAKPQEIIPAGGLRFWRLHRDLEAEKAWRKKAVQARFGLKSGPPPLLRLRARVHPLDFLLRKVPLLAEAGFAVFGAKDLTKWRVRTSRPRLQLRVTSSGEDWFDLQAQLVYDDQAVPLRTVLNALRRGERYIKLADGTLGEIPEDLQERLRELLNLGRWKAGDQIQMAKSQAALLEEMLDQLQARDDVLVEVQEEDIRRVQERLQALQQVESLPEVPLPQGLKTQLRPYQVVGYRWLHLLYRLNLGGVLADDMGLGKTVQALAFLLSLREQGVARGPDLVVVPRSLLFNWQREIETFTPDLRYLIYAGPNRPGPEELKQYDVVLTTYGIVLRDIEALQKVPFHVLILDEAQAIKNPMAKTTQAVRRLQARFRLALTGTPVENTTLELWSIFTAVLPGLLGTLEGFKQAFAIPIEQDRNEEAAARLRRLVGPFLLRRTKEQVAPELPPRTERVLYADMPEEQAEMYRATRDLYRRKLLEMLDKGADLPQWRMQVLEGLLRLRQLALHPVLVDPAYQGPSGKMETLMLLLETLKSEGHKALVYSQFVRMLHLVRAELDRRGWAYTYLDGSTRDRKTPVERFQTDPDIPFFLISLRAGGVGLNLTAADYVILLDPWWNPAVERQAADRTHRIGQDKPVFVYKLITRDTVEEKILRLQDRKRELVDRLIATSDAAWLRHLGREDIEALFG